MVEVKHPRAVDIAFFTNNACSVRDICKMELEITTALQFRLQYVTAFHFIGRFITASHLVIGSSGRIHTSLLSPSPKSIDEEEKIHDDHAPGR